MIAVAGWLMWRSEPGSIAMWLWGLQLVLNGLWSAVFFGKREIGWAFANIVLLWSAIAGFILTAAGLSATAALLFVPYLVWVTIASALNWSVFRLNGAVHS